MVGTFSSHHGFFHARRNIIFILDYLSANWYTTKETLDMEIYKNSENPYQEFVNAFVRENPFGEKKQIMKNCNEL